MEPLRSGQRVDVDDPRLGAVHAAAQVLIDAVRALPVGETEETVRVVNELSIAIGAVVNPRFCKSGESVARAFAGAFFGCFHANETIFANALDCFLGQLTANMAAAKRAKMT